MTRRSSAGLEDLRSSLEAERARFAGTCATRDFIGRAAVEALGGAIYGAELALGVFELGYGPGKPFVGHLNRAAV